MTAARACAPALQDAVLAALPGTQAELAAATGLSSATVSRAVAALRSDGRAHIGEMRGTPTGSPPVAVWIAGRGDGKDPRRPPKQTATERVRRHRALVSPGPVPHRVPGPDPLMHAFFSPSA